MVTAIVVMVMAEPIMRMPNVMMLMTMLRC